MGVLNVILFLISVTVVSCSEYVPALVWNSRATEDSYPIIPALSRLSSNEFTDYLLKRVKVEKPVILVFMEENLSAEDFSWKDLNGNGAFPMLSNISRMAGDVAFIPSVHDPYKAIKKLKNHNYVWRFYEKQGFDSLKDGKNAIFEVTLDEPDYLENRPDMLKRHDEKMAKIYSEALTYNPNIMVIYTGHHTSWIDAELERFKREETETNGNNTLIIADINNNVRMAVTPPILFTKDGEVVNISGVIGVPTIQQDTQEGLILRVRFPVNNDEVYVNFNFTSQEHHWWTLNNAGIQELQGLILKPSVDIGGPSEYSYFCSPVVNFTSKSISFTFENFQVQPRVKKNNFGPVINCVSFFSIEILSGLVIVFILGAVLAWGITMIMDINTNDRFDDPKGKTITITSTD